MLMPELSAPQKLNRTSFAFPRDDWSYIAIDLMSRVNAAFVRAPTSDITEKEYELYSGLRCIPNPLKEDLKMVREKGSFSGNKSVVYVRSFSNHDRYYQVTIDNIPPKSLSWRLLEGWLRKLKVRCGCPRYNEQIKCYAPEEQRKRYNDTRTAQDSPGPSIDGVLCKHVLVGWDWLVDYRGMNGYGIAGTYHFNVRGLTTAIVKDVVKRRSNQTKMPDYIVNRLYRDEMELFCKPIIDLLSNTNYTRSRLSSKS